MPEAARVEPDVGEGPVDGVVVDVEAEVHVVGDRRAEELQAGVLEGHRRVTLGDRQGAVVESHASVGWHEQAREDPGQRRLPRAVGTHDDHA